MTIKISFEILLRVFNNFKGRPLSVSCEGNIVKLFIYTAQFRWYAGRQKYFGAYRDRIKGQRFSAHLLGSDIMLEGHNIPVVCSEIPFEILTWHFGTRLGFLFWENRFSDVNFNWVRIKKCLYFRCDLKMNKSLRISIRHEIFLIIFELNPNN